MKSLRPPAVPLVAVDPYFSLWSSGDKLTDEKTKHWSGSNVPMCGIVRIDGKPFRFIGADPGHFPALEQPTLWTDDIRAFFRTAGVRTR